MFKLCRIFNTSGNYMRMPKPLLNELKTLIAQNVLAKDIKRYTENKIKEALIFCYGETKEKPTIATVLLPLITIPIVSFLTHPIAPTEAAACFARYLNRLPGLNQRSVSFFVLLHSYLI